MKRTSEILALIAAIVTLGGALHWANRLLAHDWISHVGPATMVYAAAWTVELSILIFLYFSALSFRLLRLPKDAKRMGVWIESRKTILDIRSASESVSTMVIRYAIRCTNVHHLRIWMGTGPANVTRESPVVEAKGLPSDHSYEHDFEDKGNRRYYNIWFSPLRRRTSFLDC